VGDKGGRVLCAAAAAAADDDETLQVLPRGYREYEARNAGMAADCLVGGPLALFALLLLLLLLLL